MFASRFEVRAFTRPLLVDMDRMLARRDAEEVHGNDQTLWHLPQGDATDVEPLAIQQSHERCIHVAALRSAGQCCHPPSNE
jgi:hypothetical protein